MNAPQANQHQALSKQALIEAEQHRLYGSLSARLNRVSRTTGLVLDLAVWADCGAPSTAHEIETSTVEIGGEQVRVELWYLVRDASTSVILPRPLSLFAAARIGEAAV